ncbi:MAG: hypothetical protein R3C68_19390 [Myxococcota bacterium]
MFTLVDRTPLRTSFKLILLAMLVVASACSPSLEEAFRKGRGLRGCFSTLNACPGLFASCVLDNDSYAEKQFPGSLRFLVDADEDDTVEVSFFFVTQRDPGLSTRIFWNEPGCSDQQVYDSEGRDIFFEAGNELIFRQSKIMRKDGEHLIEVFSDAQAEVLVVVNVSSEP